MLDAKSKQVLCYLANECPSGYKVIEIVDILSVCKNFDKDYLSHTIEHLDNVGYISIKYSDKNVYCVTVLPFGRQFIEQENIEKEKYKKLKKTFLRFYIIFFIIAILGTFLGTLIYNLIL